MNSEQANNISDWSDFSDSGSEYLPDSDNNSTSSHGETSAEKPEDGIAENTQPTPSRSRKRTRNTKDWIVNQRKLSRNTGNKYVTKKGVMVPGKHFINSDCGCPKKCITLFTENERKAVFEAFWNLAHYVSQNAYIYGIVKANKVNRKRPGDGSGHGKQVSFKYFLKSNDNTQVVCKKFFLATFRISNGRLYRCISKKDTSKCKDQRGTTSSRKLDDTDIVSHIMSFPAYQSHYSRKKNPNRKYLNSELTVKKMYDMYKENCAKENKEPKKIKYYYHVFNSKFNLHFKPPHQDTCKLCDDLDLKIKATSEEDVKKQLEIQRELHQRKAESARNSLKSDLEKVNEAYVMTFDLQKALPYPKLTVSVAYYKRNSYLYNLGIHCENDKTGYKYVWDETEGGRGSQDIATCLIKHLKEKATSHTHVIAYSDSCTGQNRNIKTSLSLLKLVQDPDISINVVDLKFLVSGHSYLPNDGEFGVIESAARKHAQIYSPGQWMEIIKNSKKKLPHFSVIEMHHEDFLSTQNLETAITNRKKNYLWLQFKLAED